MSDGREGEECQCAEGENGGDGGGGVFFFGFDGSLRGHDRGNAADGAAYGEQRGELGGQLEDLAQQRHYGEREDQLEEDEDQRHAADVQDVAENELGADEDDAELQPQLVGGDAGAEDLRQRHRVGDEEAEDDGPEDVLNAREGDVVRCLEPGSHGFQSLTGDTDPEEQQRSRHQRQELAWLQGAVGGGWHRYGLSGQVEWTETQETANRKTVTR